MVTIQPLHFEKVTAFKERIQLLNKINEIIAELEHYPTETEMMEYVSDELSDYYTKEEVNELIADIDLSDYYTKQEVNTINNLVNYYNITQLNATFEQINDRIISGEETLEDEIAGKQDLLTAGTGITIIDNVISSTEGINEGFVQYTESTDWSIFKDSNNRATKDLCLVFPVGTTSSAYVCYVFKGEILSFARYIASVFYLVPNGINIEIKPSDFISRNASADIVSRKQDWSISQGVIIFNTSVSDSSNRVKSLTPFATGTGAGGRCYLFVRD